MMERRIFSGAARRIGWALVLPAVWVAPAWAGDSGDELLGRWLTEGGESIVEIYKEIVKAGEPGAEEETRYYGKLIWIHDKAYTDRGMKVTDTLEDWNNPDASRRKDPLLGRLILNGFVYNSRKSRWEKGRAYDPESGKTYKSLLRITKGDDGEERLKVRGYIGVSFIGRTAVWTRAKDD